ncbi:hypothetical protein [Cyclobacterium xiamenense]|jgi:hypothetical protein|uniref:hypothetical protein n=1 Tax=Cyclobacterium xiamenense TaxID=1297121 RepID=UPI0012B7517F|nr:hypothetical protein [Cyclobacterium xiamenense]
MQLDTLSAMPPDSSSLEIRWFFSKPVPELKAFVLAAFRLKPLPEIRTDVYYPIPGREDLGLKTREGENELKKRRQSGLPLFFHDSQAGYLEIWDKWVVENGIEQEGYLNSISIRKKRWALKFTLSETGAWEVHPYESYLPRGIQMEYTALSWRDCAYFTFGLEGFGSVGQAEVEQFLALVPPCSELSLDHSSGYPAWIFRL